MKKLSNEHLLKHTTFRIGGTSPEFYIPESKDELIQLVKQLNQNNQPFRIIGNGSNLLISDSGIKESVISNTKSCDNIIRLNDNVVYVGSAVKVQRMIRFCVNENLDAPFYLFSVPATIGGCVFMNAGRGKTYNQQISDCLLRVELFDGDKVFWMNKAECDFKYRSSVFHSNRGLVILGAEFKFENRLKSEGEILIQERMKFVKEIQDYNAPTAGSVFKIADFRILKFLRGLRFGGARYSQKTLNWIKNDKNGTFKDVKRLINISLFFHKLFRRPIELEIEIWE